MDKSAIRLTTLIDSSALDSFSLNVENPGQTTGSLLFPYLDDQMADLSCTMMDDQNQQTSKPNLTARTLLDAAEKALMYEGGKLHVRDLQDKMIEYGLIPHSAKSLANLESILYRETFNDNSKFKRIEGHLGWFALVGFDVDDMESGRSSSEEEDQSESMEVMDTPPKPKLNKTSHGHDYKKKYYALRKMVKELVFLNAATSDDIARTEAKLARAKAERKFLLKRLFQYQAASEAGVLQPHGLISFDVNLPQSLTDFPTNIPKQGKPKVKKQASKTKEEKGNLSKTKSALHKKLTQAKLTVQAKNMAKLAGQYHRAVPKTSTKSPASQSKVTEKAKDVSGSSSTQQTVPQSEEAVQVPKDKKTERSKSSRPKVKKPKPSESPQNSSSTAATAAKTEGGEVVKPKRKKPGTAIKRKVQPIPVDSKGKPIFPIVLGGLTVHSLGEIISDRPGFHSERYIWPVGYCSSRTYPSIKDPEKKCIYTCKILDGGFGPQFEMCPEDDPDHPINASSATACHCVVLKALNKARGRDASNTGSGPEFFGYSHPTIQYLIQNLPGAKKCTKYQWVKFELPKPQSKQGGKLSSACKLNLESQVSPHEPPHHLSSSSSQEDTGVGDDSTLEHHDSNLTLHSSAITDNEDDLFEDIDIQTSLRPLTLESSNATLSGQIGDITADNDMDPDIDPLMSSSASGGFSTSLPMTLSPPSLTSPSSTVTGNGSFMMPLTSPLFGSSSGFPPSDLTDLPKQ